MFRQILLRPKSYANLTLVYVIIQAGLKITHGTHINCHRPYRKYSNEASQTSMHLIQQLALVQRVFAKGSTVPCAFAALMCKVHVQTYYIFLIKCPLPETYCAVPHQERSSRPAYAYIIKTMTFICGNKNFCNFQEIKFIYVTLTRQTHQRGIIQVEHIIKDSSWVMTSKDNKLGLRIKR